MYIREIEKWFENYDKWVHQAERAERLGIAWEQEDKILKVTHHSLNELDLKAEEMRTKYKEELAKVEKQRQEWIANRKGGGKIE